jgi:hypothetical protein
MRYLYQLAILPDVRHSLDTFNLAPSPVS